MKTITAIDRLWPTGIEGGGPVYIIDPNNSKHVKIGKIIKIKYNDESFPYKIKTVESVNFALGITVERITGVYYPD